MRENSDPFFSNKIYFIDSIYIVNVCIFICKHEINNWVFPALVVIMIKDFIVL